MISWNTIVDQHGPLVWRTAYRLLGNEADAADCYQEAFAAALVFSQRAAVQNWPGLLRRLTTTHALDRLRRRLKDHARRSAAADVDALAGVSPGPAQLAQDQELIAWLRSALTELPDQQAQVFWLICIDELTYHEAAAQLEIDAGHVGVLLHRARARLRELLGPALGNKERDAQPHTQ